jgi:cell wall-associated NlpC family hydrolase
MIARVLAVAMLAFAPGDPGVEHGVLDVRIRFEVDGLDSPPGTTFPRLPAGLPVALVPEVRADGVLVAPLDASAAGMVLRWMRIDPADPVTSNLQRNATTGDTRLGVTPLSYVVRPLQLADPWRVDADAIVRVGTGRFMLVVDRPGEPFAASTPGPQTQLELAPGTAGGLSTAVYGLTRRPGETLGDVAAELVGLPFLFHPRGTPPAHQTESRVGTDCTSTFVYAMRRLGGELTYYGPRDVWQYLDVEARSLRVGPDGIYRDADGTPVRFDASRARVGDLLHFGTQLSMLVQDRWPFGVLDANDLLLQAWRSSPHRVTVRESEFADQPAAVVRFKADLSRRADLGLVVEVEDSHAGAFFHLRPALALGPATLVHIDAHSDAAPKPSASTLVRHEATTEWLAGLRARGVVQPFDWIDALIPWGIDRVLWLGPWDEVNREAAEHDAKALLGALARRFPDRGFETRADRFSTSTMEGLLALSPASPIVLSIDLDYLLRGDGSVDDRRAEHIRRVLDHFTSIRAVSVALSRPYFPDDAAFERALRNLSAVLWSSARVDAVEVHLAPVQADDRSDRVKAIRAAGLPVPRPHAEQFEETPGFRLVDAPPHATLGLLGDVYLSKSDSPVPAALSAMARPSWMAPERRPLLLNLETPVADDRPVQGYPTFNRHGDLLDWLAAQGVLVVSVANNHALDQGPAGLRATISAARRRGIGVVGGWMPGEGSAGVERMRIGDLRVAVLGVTYGLNATDGFEGNVDVVRFEAYPQTAELRRAEEGFLLKVRQASKDADAVVVVKRQGKLTPKRQNF